MARRGIGKFSENDFAARILAGIIRQRSAADIDDLGANSRRSCLGAKAEGGDILSAAYLAGFPPADLQNCGPSVIVHAYTQDQADAAADRLADQIVAAEADFIQPLFGVDEGISKAIEIAKTASRPVVVADTQDNPGCGGTADTTGVLEALVRLGAKDAVLGIFWDPDAAAMAHQAGEGKTIWLALGGEARSGRRKALRG
jgi:microcystin degradation protein MlrC